MVTSAAMASFRSPQLMIAPLDTTAHLRKLQAPEQSDAPSWTLDSSVAPDPRPCSSPPKPASSSEAVVPVPPASGAPVSAGPSEASETWDDAFQSTSQPSSRTASSVSAFLCPAVWPVPSKPASSGRCRLRSAATTCQHGSACAHDAPHPPGPCASVRRARTRCCRCRTLLSNTVACLSCFFLCVRFFPCRCTTCDDCRRTC